MKRKHHIVQDNNGEFYTLTPVETTTTANIAVRPIRPGAGPGGYCVCPQCGSRVKHVAGVPCTDTKCPNCGHVMIRE